ncbi:MAG: PTS sugar transporter subunit IIA [Planctomycetota bacterium]|jgi:mannitol/fructose-specific phosphotransferase system IIA component (Ntr-type)
MKITDFLDDGLCWVFETAESQDSLLRQLADRVGESLEQVDPDELYTGLLEREAKGSTATPEGVALPHAIVGGIDKTYVAVALVKEGAPFAGGNCDLVFLLIGPKGSEWEHVRVLARVARVCNGADSLKALREASDGADLHARLVAEDGRHA